MSDTDIVERLEGAERREIEQFEISSRKTIEIVKLKAQITRLRALVEWQPIDENIPRDGTEIWIYREDSGAILARWMAPCDFLNESEQQSHGLEDCWDEEDWFFADFVCGGRWDGPPPTHYKLLGPPPETRDE